MAIDYSVLPLPKPEPRKRVKARKRRAETKVKLDVRAACVERDGVCRIGRPWTDRVAGELFATHSGPSEWAHLHERRRSKTRGMEPTVRHDTRYSLMLCKRHHEQYDAKRLQITALTRKGCDGPLKFRMKS